MQAPRYHRDDVVTLFDQLVSDIKPKRKNTIIQFI